MKLSLALLAAIVMGGVLTAASAAIVSPYVANAFSQMTEKTADTIGRGVAVLASDDDNEDRQYRREDRGSDDAEASEHNDDDDEGAGGTAANPAPAGTVAPPANGLFGKGPAPSVQVH
jgi:hypothetical protein